MRKGASAINGRRHTRARALSSSSSHVAATSSRCQKNDPRSRLSSFHFFFFFLRGEAMKHLRHNSYF